MTIELDGRPVSPDVGRVLAMGGYGHFTAMQVRDRRTRGLHLHLSRLIGATRELFALELAAELVRERIRHALGPDTADASVRVHVFVDAPSPSNTGGLSILVSVRPPAPSPAAVQRVKSVVYQRPVAHIKHLGGFAQQYFRTLVARDGYDEALLTDRDGAISEGAITNIGFLDGDTVVWPDAPALAGITMQLLQQGLNARGVAQERRAVRLPDVAAFEGAFLANSRGVCALDRVDTTDLPVQHRIMAMLHDIYDSTPWDAL